MVQCLQMVTRGGKTLPKTGCTLAYGFVRVSYQEEPREARVSSTGSVRGLGVRFPYLLDFILQSHFKAK